MERKTISNFARVVPAVMLLLALGSWEYSYYQLLRIVVFAGSIYLVWYLLEKKQTGWAWGFIVTGILFNPFYPIYLDRNIWQFLDITSSILFFASFSTESKNAL